jgi:hypothetical protein
MNSILIDKCDLTDIKQKVINPNGTLKILPSVFFQQFEKNTMQYFMLQMGIYVLPTTELISFLQDNIEGKAIEIGCGNGAIGRALGIPITDSKIQEDDRIKILYASIKQPVIQYPRDVEKLEAIEAVEKHKPNTVIGAFVTHKFNGISGYQFGVVEGKILKLADKYINISNIDVHKDKPILKYPHQKYYFDWLITRGINQLKNRIWIFPSTK